MQDGALLGDARDPKHYALLVSDHEYADFTLKVKFKFREGNSGVYIRSQTREPDEAARTADRNRPQRRQFHERHLRELRPQLARQTTRRRNGQALQAG